MITPDQILALSPDDASSKAAKGLLAPAKWPLLGFSEDAIWGHCQGSGSKPYQVMIDVASAAFKCSCPSRKFPCKHGLALYLLRVQKESSFTAGDPPTWIVEWMESRKGRAEKQAEKQAAQAEKKAATPADPEAAAKREAKRLSRMVAGAGDLARWLEDTVRHGLSDLESKDYTYWEQPAARMVDAQAIGLANAVREMQSFLSTGSQHWTQETLAAMGRLYLLIEALGRLGELPAPLQADVRSAVGWPMDKDEVYAAGERVEDQWRVLGISFEENDRLWERRVWLRGLRSGRDALLLDFSHGQRRFEQSFLCNGIWAGTLVYFPSTAPLRALTLEVKGAVPGAVAASTAGRVAGAADWEAAFARVATALAGNPWFLKLPITLDAVMFSRRDDEWMARDIQAREAPLWISEEDAWKLQAISGGQPLRVFGEWEAGRWRPLSAWKSQEDELCWTEGVTQG